MATKQATISITLKANADLSTKQHLFVELTAAQTVDVTNAITDKAVGVLNNKPDAAGKAAEVDILGTTKVVCSAALAAGTLVGPTAAGKAQAAVSTQYARGMLLEASTADGDIVEMLLLPMTVMA